MTELKSVLGVWVPARDAKLTDQTPVIDGLPDFGVSTAKTAMAYCARFSTALDIGGCTPPLNSSKAWGWFASRA